MPRGATLHDSLHFVPGLGDGRKSDGYLETAGKDGGRAFTGYKPGFGKDQIMANTGGNLLKSFETSFMNHAYNGNGSEQQFKTLVEDDKKNDCADCFFGRRSDRLAPGCGIRCAAGVCAAGLRADLLYRGYRHDA